MQVQLGSAALAAQAGTLNYAGMGEGTRDLVRRGI